MLERVKEVGQIVLDFADELGLGGVGLVADLVEVTSGIPIGTIFRVTRFAYRRWLHPKVEELRRQHRRAKIDARRRVSIERKRTKKAHRRRPARIRREGTARRYTVRRK